MRYYIVDNNGNTCGESDSKIGIELLFSCFTQEEIEECEMEIITDENYGE